jgi:phosphoenolpyruvate carboxykinase (ATP)
MSVPRLAISPLVFEQSLLQGKGVHYQTAPSELVSDSLRLRDGRLSSTGALVINTGKFTGRSPKDKFIVKDDVTADTVNWNDFNQPLEERYFLEARRAVETYLAAQPELWVRDCFACADEHYRLPVRVVSQSPAMDLFAYNMFIRPSNDDLEDFLPEWTVFSAPGLQLDPVLCGVRQGNASIISFKYKTILIAGSGYTGELKKGIFTVLNYVLPLHENVLSMHCSANMADDGSTALFFGLSGTGKTTLSADPERHLIGDDEHGWSNHGIFNCEGGCYAKTIDLTEEREPAIFHAIQDGALLENVGFKDESDVVDYSSRVITENTRVSYPIHFIANAADPSIGNMPSHIFFLTCDAHGILPPIAKLTPEQAMYQFISGYTAKVAGTESDVVEPKSTFSACFGAPFIPLHPGTYARMLGDKISKHRCQVWLINTGWTGGAYGIGTRIKLSYTRAMIAAALNGSLENSAMKHEGVFGFACPLDVPGVPAQLLQPRNTWLSGSDYDVAAAQLAEQFKKNFAQYATGVSKAVAEAGPVL